jgi:hypothetical protein
MSRILQSVGVGSTSKEVWEEEVGRLQSVGGRRKSSGSARMTSGEMSERMIR